MRKICACHVKKLSIIGWKSLCVKVTVKPMVMLKILPDEKRYPYTLAVRNFLKVENCGEINFP